MQEFTFNYAPTNEESSDINFNITTNAGSAVIELRGAGIITGIPGIENSNVKIFTPAPGKISVTTLENSKVKVSDILGRTKTYNVVGSPLEISVYSGIYIISVETGNNTYTKKVIVK